MQKGFVLIAIMLLSHTAFSQALYLNDGCNSLSAIVERGASGARAESGHHLVSNEFGLMRCARTAESTTSAFSRAMERFSITVRWDGGGVASGDVCLSHRLSECYPRFDRPNAPLGFGERQFAIDRWGAIQRAVGATLRQPAMPDFSVFQTGTLIGRIDEQLAADGRAMGGQ